MCMHVNTQCTIAIGKNAELSVSPKLLEEDKQRGAWGCMYGLGKDAEVYT